MLKLPTQPVALDEGGSARFVPNALVKYLLEHGGIDMNALAAQPFPQEDRIQFAQLIGYSVAGFGSLSYVTDESYASASVLAEEAQKKRTPR